MPIVVDCIFALSDPGVFDAVRGGPVQAVPPVDATGQEEQDAARRE